MELSTCSALMMVMRLENKSVTLSSLTIVNVVEWFLKNPDNRHFQLWNWQARKF